MDDKGVNILWETNGYP